MDHSRLSPLYVIVLIGFLLVGCDEEDECSKCSEAINHMRSKIADNSCNPNFMQEAQARIREECNRDDNEAIGYLAESCYFDYGMDINCTKIAYGYEIYDQAERPFQVFNNAQPEGDSLIFKLSRNQDFFSASIDTLGPNESAELRLESGQNYLGQQVQFVVLQMPLLDTVLSDSKTISYARPDLWHTKREIHLTYSEAFEGYTSSYQNW